MKHLMKLLERPAPLAGGLFTVAAAIALTVAAPAAFAAPGAKALEMVVYTDSVQGRRLVKGDWEKAMGMEAPKSMGAFEALNNRCVSLTVAKEFAAATEACDAAVAAAGDEPGADMTGFAGQYVPSSAKVEKAMALTNRGVLRALQGDRTGARVDFEDAAGMTRRVSAAKANLEVLGATTTLAQAE